MNPQNENKIERKHFKHKKLGLLLPLFLMGIAGVSAAIVASYQVTSTVTVSSTSNLFLVALSNGGPYATENFGSVAPPIAVDGAGFCYRNLGNTALWFGGSQSYSISSGAIPNNGSTLTIVADGDSTFTAIAPTALPIGGTVCGPASGYHLHLSIPAGTVAGVYNFVVRVNAFDVSTI